MSTSCGACGAFGILLSGIDVPAVAEIRTQMNEIVANYNDEDMEYNSPEEYPEIIALLDPLKQVFLENGITVPEGASIMWTGSEDDRPSRCDTQAEQWVLGFGLFTRPDQFPAMDATFLDASEWHTWVWLG